MSHYFIAQGLTCEAHLPYQGATKSVCTQPQNQSGFRLVAEFNPELGLVQEVRMRVLIYDTPSPDVAQGATAQLLPFVKRYVPGATTFVENMAPIALGLQQSQSDSFGGVDIDLIGLRNSQNGMLSLRVDP